MSEPIALVDAVNRILTLPRPVLILDTCALLDLIRIPFRARSVQEASQTIASALEIIMAVHQETPNLWVIIPPLVFDEWEKHKQPTLGELKRHWDGLDTKIEIANTTASVLNIDTPSNATYKKMKIEEALENLSSAFLQNTLLLIPNPTCEERAYKRTIKEEAPARKGGQTKDCTIVEHAIELCRQLRNLGFEQKCVFLTSNQIDFCEKNSSIPKEPLNHQFNEISMVLTTKWNWTKAELGI